MGFNLNTVGQTAHGAGKGVHMIANYEAWNPTHNRAVHEVLHPDRAWHAWRDGTAVGLGVGGSDYGLKSYAPGFLLDLKKGRRLFKREERHPGVRRMVNRVKHFTHTKKFKKSALGTDWRHLEKTGKPFSKKAERKHREAEEHGEHGLQALTGAKINRSYLKARRQQKENAVAPEASKSKSSEKDTGLEA